MGDYHHWKVCSRVISPCTLPVLFELDPKDELFILSGAKPDLLNLETDVYRLRFLTDLIATMNNEQFRHLLVDNSSSSKSNDKPAPQARNAPGGATPSGGLLGSRMRSSIPMTPYVSPAPISISRALPRTSAYICTDAP